jgi:hypothetical protein
VISRRLNCRVGVAVSSVSSSGPPNATRDSNRVREPSYGRRTGTQLPSKTVNDRTRCPSSVALSQANPVLAYRRVNRAFVWVGIAVGIILVFLGLFFGLWFAVVGSLLIVVSTIRAWTLDFSSDQSIAARLEERRRREEEIQRQETEILRRISEPPKQASNPPTGTQSTEPPIGTLPP